MRKRQVGGALVIWFAHFFSLAHATLDFDGTNRFIFAEGAQRLSIVVTNNSAYPTLLQTSLSWGDGRQQELPMALNTPMQVLPANGRGDVEVFYEGSGFASDRESYVLLSALDVSQAPKEPNTVQLALVHHFKLFFRPTLASTVEQGIAGLRWQGKASAAPTIQNDSPYFITLSDIELRTANNQRCGEIISHVMVAPFSTAELVSTCTEAMASVYYDYVTDRGGMRPYEARLSHATATVGTQVEE